MTSATGAQNGIGFAQDTPEMLQLLAAQRHLYRSARSLLAWDLALSVAVPAALVALGLRWPALGPWATGLALVAAAADNLLLDRVQRRRRELGARTQEQFDVQVLELPWNADRVGERVDPEMVAAAAKRVSDPRELHKLRGWYPTAVVRVPIGIARLICQRTNCRWDESLRREVSTFCKAAVVLIAAGVIAVGLFTDWSVLHLLTVLVGPLAPLVARCIRQWVRHDDTVERLTQLRQDIATAWRGALDGSLRGDALLAVARRIQDRIYEHRKDAPLVSERIYSLRKREHQFQADAGADALVSEALAALQF